MAQLEYFLVAEGVVVDRHTNKTSIFNVLEEATITPALPEPVLGSDGQPKPGLERVVTNASPIVAVALLRMDEQDFDRDIQAVLRVKAGTQAPLDFTTTVKCPRGSKRHRLTFRLEGMPFGDTGDTIFELLLDGQHLAEHLVTVTVRPPSAAGPQH